MNSKLIDVLKTFGIYTTETNICSSRIPGEAPDISIKGYYSPQPAKPITDSLKNWQEAIYELNSINQKFMNHTLRTQTEALQAVRAKEFIIASVSVNGDFSIAESPAVHDSATDARVEAKRLAKLSPGKAFVMLQLAGAEMVPVDTVSI